MIGNLGEFRDSRLPDGNFEVEPWMIDFVKGRHSQEEWDAFFEYCKAGPIKRRFLRIGSFFYYIILGSR